MRFSRAQQRYNRDVALCLMVYAVVLVAAIRVFGHAHPRGAVAYLVAVLPALPLLGVFMLFGRYLATEADEYLRAIQVRQSLIATGLTLSLATVWGFLEGFGLVPHLVAWWWPTLWTVGLGIGALVTLATERHVR